MSKFSVKKPLTVFVAVVITIVLGIVSYTRMTPTLLPNMDLPYIVVVTTYPGASPEKVELAVTKPIEESLGTLENIQNVTSTSSENYSMVMLEFSENANLDSATVDILQKFDQLESSFDDMVGSPYIMKINMDSLPIAMAAVDMEGMDTAEMSQFMEDELLTKLEGINGVASVTASGLLDEQVEIVLSQDKILALNDSLYDALGKQFDEAASELEDAKSEVESQQDKLDSGQAQLDSGQGQLADGLAEAEGQLSSGQQELQEGKTELKNQIKDLSAQLTELETTEKTLKGLQATIEKLEQAQEGLETLISTIEQTLASMNISPVPDEFPLDDIKAMLGDQAALLDGINTMGDLRASLQEVNEGLDKIDSSLAAMGLSRSDIAPALGDIASGKAQIKAGITTMEGMLTQLEAGNMQLQDAQKELSRQKTKGILDLSSASTQMIVGQSSIAAALTQIESGLEQIEDAKEAAYESADMMGIVTIDMVAAILMAQNFSMPAGSLEEDGISYAISVGDAFESVEELEDLLLLDMDMDGIEPIYLKDVADIVRSDNSDEIFTRINGNTGVILSFSKQSNAATAEASDAINAKFEELEEEYEGLSFTNLMDQGDYIYLIVNSIMQNLIFGAVFAVLILFIFLKDLRPTFITLISIPVSVLFAIVLMYFSGVTLNMFSLSGLAVAVGMLVDNSVVVIENVYRLRYKGYSAIKSAVSGAAQVAGAIMASTLTTICVFLPIIFVDGLTRQLFMDFALTFGYALLASLIIALTLVPAMASGLLVKEPKQHKQQLMDKLQAAYGVAIEWTLSHKVIVLLASVLLLVLSTVLAFAKGFTFMPDMGSDSVSVSLEMEEGAVLEDTIKAADDAIERIQGIDGVETVGAMLSGGSSMMMSFGGSSSDTSVTMYVLLEEETNRDTTDIADEVNKICADIPKAEVTADSSAMMDMSALMGSGVSIYLYGTELEEMQDAAREVAAIMEGVAGIDEVSDGMEDADPGLKFIVDKEAAMKHSLTVAQVYQEIAAAMTNEKTATTLDVGTNSYDVVVHPEEDEKVTLSDLKNLTITVTKQGMDGSEEKEDVKITDIAEIVETETMNSISRENHKRYMTVSGTLAEGENATLVTRAVQDAMNDYEAPNGIELEYAGENETTMEAMVELLKMLGLGILLVYLVMVAQFQSLKSPFIIMFTIPLAFTGGFLGLLITGQEVSVISLIGFVMLVGIIVNNGIVLVDYINQLRADGADKREAIVEAGITRMRPILMTTITTILGLLVTALSGEMGAAMMKPIAIVCIGGLTYATILTMFVVPCMYDILNRKTMRTIDADDLIITDDISEL